MAQHSLIFTSSIEKYIYTNSVNMRITHFEILPKCPQSALNNVNIQLGFRNRSCPINNASLCLIEVFHGVNALPALAAKERHSKREGEYPDSDPHPDSEISESRPDTPFMISRSSNSITGGKELLTQPPVRIEPDTAFHTRSRSG